jgi:hypothetical protein
MANVAVSFFCGFQVSSQKQLTLEDFATVVVKEARGWLANKKIDIPSKDLNQLETVAVLCSFLSEGTTKIQFQVALLFLLYYRYNSIDAIKTRIQEMTLKQEFEKAVAGWMAFGSILNMDARVLEVWGLIKSIGIPID